VSFDASGAPPQGQPGGNGVLISAQTGDEGGECGIAGSGACSHSLREVTAAAPGQIVQRSAELPPGRLATAT
jgi:hypothetical protein